MVLEKEWANTFLDLVGFYVPATIFYRLAEVEDADSSSALGNNESDAIRN